MNQEIIYLIAVVFVIIIVIKLLTMSKAKLEHLTSTSDEAIQNIASLYNKDQMTIGNLTATGTTTLNNAKLNNVTASNGNIDTIKTGKLLLGNKWILTLDGKDTQGYDDHWLRFLDTNGGYPGGIAAGTFYDASMASTIKAYIDTQIQNNRPNCNWEGWNVVCGGCSDQHDDYAMYCSGGKIANINVANSTPWGYNGRTLPGNVYPW
ncbi:hypothetical protein Indivirus_12_2 [Indivirus ILV1]|uniref:Uncharacterized protein n=1 Tax=Indivirus ILV1 TaxID=1977633 RepID=A0A1V0SEM0_9VIRU|nr:hypothetical protein Indivirus_12_2 [Indivirus ILV1]